MRIRQMMCGLGHFKNRLCEKYGFVPYQNPDEPVIAFGMYYQGIINKVLHNNATVIIVWSGTDAYDFCYRPELLNWGGLAQKKNIRHIATSKWISDDLGKCGVSHICLPVVAATIPKENFRPVPLGNKIYTYSFVKRPVLYGKEIIDTVKEKLSDIEFIDVKDEEFKLPHTPEEMPKVYEQCFMGLRPTVHDGCSSTVAELGLMGRRCIHNGWLPGSIHWYGVDDIVQSIREEQKKIGSTDKLLAKQIARYITVPDNWLDTEFYK